MSKRSAKVVEPAPNKRIKVNAVQPTTTKATTATTTSVKPKRNIWFSKALDFDDQPKPPRLFPAPYPPRSILRPSVHIPDPSRHAPMATVPSSAPPSNQSTAPGEIYTTTWRSSIPPALKGNHKGLLKRGKAVAHPSMSARKRLLALAKTKVLTTSTTNSTTVAAAPTQTNRPSSACTVPLVERTPPLPRLLPRCDSNVSSVGRNVDASAKQVSIPACLRLVQELNGDHCTLASLLRLARAMYEEYSRPLLPGASRLSLKHYLLLPTVIYFRSAAATHECRVIGDLMDFCTQAQDAYNHDAALQ